MQKYKKDKFSEADLGTNPLTKTMLIPVSKQPMDGQYYKDKESDQLVKNIAELERTPYCKVYVTAENRILYSALSPRAKELWGWLQYEVEPAKDYVWINKVRFMEEVGMGSINTYSEAVSQLVRYNFLCLTVVRDVYWINPEYMFNGNRLKKYPDNIVVKK